MRVNVCSIAAHAAGFTQIVQSALPNREDAKGNAANTRSRVVLWNVAPTTAPRESAFTWRGALRTAHTGCC